MRFEEERAMAPSEPVSTCNMRKMILGSAEGSADRADVAYVDA